MKTAIDILKECVEKTDLKLRSKKVFGNSYEAPFIHFESGNTQTIVNSVSKIMVDPTKDPFPLIAVFTENLKESYSKNNTILEFNVSKISIAIRSVADLTESQRIQTSFKNILHKIFEEFSKQLNKVNFGFDLKIEKIDIPTNTTNSKVNELNDTLDGIVIKDLKMRVLINNC